MFLFAGIVYRGVRLLCDAIVMVVFVGSGCSVVAIIFCVDCDLVLVDRMLYWIVFSLVLSAFVVCFIVYFAVNRRCCHGFLVVGLGVCCGHLFPHFDVGVGFPVNLCYGSVYSILGVTWVVGFCCYGDWTLTFLV